MKKRIVVTGGAGFIGSQLTRKLYERKYDVVVFDDFSNASGKQNLPKNITIVRKSILNISALHDAFKHAEAVFHLAVKPLTMSFNKPEEVVRVNDYGTYLVAKVCTDLKIKLVHVSSSEAYGTAKYIPMKENHPFLPSTIYASSKAAAEHYVRGFEKTDGLKAVIVRPFNSYGPYMREDDYAAALPHFYNRISSGHPPIIHGTGNQTRDFTYVEDTAEGIILASEEPKAIGDTFNIAQGKEVRIKEMAKIMLRKYSEITGKNLNFDLKYDKPRRGDVKRHLADISHARKIFGYKPKITFENGISKYILWKLSGKHNTSHKM
jgi:UDP-glucose 4-epimerase